MATARHKEATKKKEDHYSISSHSEGSSETRTSDERLSFPASTRRATVSRYMHLYGGAVHTSRVQTALFFDCVTHTHLHTERRSGKHYNSSWQLTSNSRSCDVHISDVVVTGWAPVSTVPLWVFYYSQLPHLVNALFHSGTHTAKSTRPYHIAPHWLYAA